MAESKLRDASGCADLPRLFAELLDLFDRDHRLITPAESGPDSPPGSGAAWQLTHDHLVPAMRDWLHLRQAANICGRAGIRLRDRAAEFRLRPEGRTSAGVAGWLRFQILTNAKAWPPEERRFMERGRRRAAVTGLAAFAAALGIWLGTREWLGYDRAWTAASSIITAPASEVTRRTTEHASLRRWLVPGSKPTPWHRPVIRQQVGRASYCSRPARAMPGRWPGPC